MARRKQGWELRPPSGKRANYSVRFWSPAEDRQVEPSCGTKDPAAAARRAREIYAEHLTREPAPKKEKVPEALPFDGVAELFRADQASQLDDEYVNGTLKVYHDRWAKVFPNMLLITSDAIAQQIAKRMTEVIRESVEKDRSALVKLLKWSKLKGLIATLPDVPSISDVCGDSPGTQFSVRRRCKALEYSRDEIERVLAALPEWSERQNGMRNGADRFPVRARFIVQYDCGLRSTKVLDRLSSPEHWKPGQKFLMLSRWIMKDRRPWKKPLSKRALAALESVYQGPGLLFGKRDYRWQITKAAKASMEVTKAKTFCAQHIRSARITHFLDAGASLTAAAELAGHTQVSTTARYARPGYDALVAELARQEAAD